MNTNWLTLYDVVQQRHQEELAACIRHRYFYGQADWDQLQPDSPWQRVRRLARSWLDRLATRRSAPNMAHPSPLA